MQFIGLFKGGETNALNKEVDQNGTYIELENTILPGGKSIKTVIKFFWGDEYGLSEDWEQDKCNSSFLYMQYPPESFFC